MAPPASIHSPAIENSSRIPAGVLDIQKVRKRLGGNLAIDGVSLTVARGELFGLLGPNGAGKSTLLGMAAGLLRPDEGAVRIGGGLDPAEAGSRRNVGLVPQELAIYPELTARENLEFFGRLYGLAGTALKEHVSEALAAVQLIDRADERTVSFSGGMKRRLNLAVAVVHRPEVLFLDEPTTGVDAQSRVHIFDEVRRLNDAGMTIIYTSHYMEEVQSLCDRVAILDAGRLIVVGCVRNLLAAEETKIRFRAGAQAHRLLDALRRLPGVRRAVMLEGRVELGADAAAANWSELVSCLGEAGEQIADLEIHRPTLEGLFLRLTGHALRD